MKNNKDFANAIRWLEEMVESISHGEVSIKCVMHQNKVMRIDKGFIEKENADRC